MTSKITTPSSKKTRRLLLFFLKISFIATILILITVVGVFVYFTKDLPDPTVLKTQEVAESTKIYDRTGTVLLYDIHGEEQRTIIPYEEIPIIVKNATIAVEDEKFWKHKGIDIRAMLRALSVVIKTRKFEQGGSTITQQLIKKSFLTSDKTVVRKIREIVLAVALERKYSKEEILSAYLNQIPYGSGAYGIEAASQTFFGKKARDLNLAETSLLVSLPKAPSYYSPFGNHTQELEERRKYALWRMEQMDFISKEEKELAQKNSPKVLPFKQTIKAPHFVFMVRDQLNEKFGEEMIEKSGFKVITSLDWDLQQVAEETVRQGAIKNQKLFKAQNAALVATDPKTGQLLSLVGSWNYFDIEHDGNVNVATRARQPGSAFKPFVYATAFKKGYTPDTVLFDVFTEFNPTCKPAGIPRGGGDPKNCYHPVNFDDRFRGPVTIRQALGQSLNTPAVKALYLAGLDDSMQTAKDMGITTLEDKNRFGLSLALGGGEVKLLEMANAFGVFGQEGVRHEPSLILRVEDPYGHTLYHWQDNPKQVLDSQTARLVNNILSDNQARIPTFNPQGPLFFYDHEVALKTGTTEDYRDAWTIGYTPYFSWGMWVGNNDNSPMQRNTASLMAAPIWREFYDSARKLFPDKFSSEPFKKPESIATSKPVLNGVWKVETSHGEELHSILYWVKKLDPQGDPPSNPYTDPQFNNWETGVQIWLTQQGLKLVTGGQSSSSVTIQSPQDSSSYSKNDDINIVLQVNSSMGVKQVDLLLNNIFIGSLLNDPFETIVKNNDPLLKEGSNTITARLYDKAGGVKETQKSFIVAP